MMIAADAIKPVLFNIMERGLFKHDEVFFPAGQLIEHFNQLVFPQYGGPVGTIIGLNTRPKPEYLGYEVMDLYRTLTSIYRGRIHLVDFAQTFDGGKIGIDIVAISRQKEF